MCVHYKGKLLNFRHTLCLAFFWHFRNWESVTEKPDGQGNPAIDMQKKQERQFFLFIIVKKLGPIIIAPKAASSRIDREHGEDFPI